MIKFKVGDKVRVRKDAPKNNWVASMDKYINCVMTVDNIFSDGARLVIERLFAPEPYNHKLVCTRGAGHFRMGKLYEVKDGILYGDVGYETGIGDLPPYKPFTNLNSVNLEMVPNFIEYVEE